MPDIQSNQPLIIYTSKYKDISFSVEAPNVTEAQKLIKEKIKELEKQEVKPEQKNELKTIKK